MAKIFFIVLFCIFGATLASKEEIIKQFMEYGEACMKEVGAAPSDIDDMIKKLPASGPEAKCMRACIFKKYKLIDDNGKHVKSVAMEHAKVITDNDPEKMKIAVEIIDACDGLAVSADHCEAAESYERCFMEQAKAHGVEKIDF